MSQHFTKEECREEALKYFNRAKFKTFSPKHYRKASAKGWLEELCKHMTALRHIFTKQECAEEALKYNTKTEFQKGSNKYYRKAHQEGWLDEICSHTNVLRYYYTKEECSFEAIKYNTRKEFETHATSCYHKAHREGWLDEICKHMVVLLRRYTKEECIEEALKYKYRYEFRENSLNFYRHSCRKGWIDELCSHMYPGSRGYSRSKPGYIYITAIITRYEEYVGFGITNNLTKRMKQHKLNCEREGYSCKLLKSMLFDDGSYTYRLEKHLKQVLPITDTGIPGFRTEAISMSDYHKLGRELEIYGAQDFIISQVNYDD